MLKKFFAVPIPFWVAILSVPFFFMPHVYAKDCRQWFEKLRVNPSHPNCFDRCSLGSVDMGTFTCPNRCFEFCKPKKEKDVLGYIPSLSELCDQELELVKKFPLEALKVRTTEQDALEETQNRFGGNFRDDESDAFRHCYWSGLLAKRLGDSKQGPNQASAFKWLNAHESCSRDPKGTAMDDHNNRVGTRLADDLFSKKQPEDRDLSNACYEALNEKQLEVLRPQGGSHAKN